MCMLCVSFMEKNNGNQQQQRLEATNSSLCMSTRWSNWDNRTLYCDLFCYHESEASFAHCVQHNTMLKGCLVPLSGMLTR